MRAIVETRIDKSTNKTLLIVIISKLLLGFPSWNLTIMVIKNYEKNSYGLYGMSEIFFLNDILYVLYGCLKSIIMP